MCFHRTPSSNTSECTIENLVLTPAYFILFPEEPLQILNPLEIADDDAA
jgi:hypothetical protein